MKKITFLTILFLIVLSACTKNDSDEPLPTKPIELNISLSAKKMVSSSSNFGIDLTKKIAAQETKDNWMISPLSITLALAMTYNGADGDTKKAMAETMRLNGLTIDEVNESFKDLIAKLLKVDKRVDVAIANSIWYQKGFSVLPDFIKTNKDFYNAEVQGLDFASEASKNIINNWVAGNTNNRIKKMVDKIDQNTVMFLINAIYFKGLWKYRFNPKEGVDKPFYYKNGNDKLLRMMRREADFKTFMKDDIVVVEMPYGQGNWAIDLVMTNDKRSIDEIMKQLTADQWNAWINGLARNSRSSVVLPPFKFEYDIKLNKCLGELGMGIAFDAAKANFSKINKAREMFISEVKHKTFIELNEKGTEAVAATHVVSEVTSVGPSHKVFTFDRPFMFAIREVTTNTIAFIGKVGDPKRVD